VGDVIKVIKNGERDLLFASVILRIDASFTVETEDIINELLKVVHNVCVSIC